MLGIKRWFDELFDGYLVEESIWGFRVLIGKRKGFIWSCKEEENERIVIRGCMNSIRKQYHKKEKKKREKRNGENSTRRPTRLNAQNHSKLLLIISSPFWIYIEQKYILKA